MEDRNSTRSATTTQGLLFLFSVVCVFGVALATGPSTTPQYHGHMPVRYVVFDLGPGFVPTAINNNIVVVGNGPPTNNLSALAVPQVWAGGSLTPLSTNYPGWYLFQAVGIDDANQIAGNMWHSLPVPTNSMVVTGCYWSDTNAATAPIPLGPTAYSPSSFTGNKALVAAIPSPGFIVGYTEQSFYDAVQFNPAWTDYSTNYWSVNPWQLPCNDLLAQWSWPFAGAGTTNWCGNVEGFGFGPPVINGTTYTNYPAFEANAINTNSDVVGVVEGTNAVMAVPTSSTALAITTLGPGKATAINDYLTTTVVGTTTNVSYAPQIIGVDANGNPMLWDQTYTNGLATPAGVYLPKSLNPMIQQVGGVGFQLVSVTGINKYGMIVGTAYFGDPYAPVLHGVLLLPNQFFLLNGDTNIADVDGMDFAGNRYTNIGSTEPDDSIASNAIGYIGSNSPVGDSGIDVLGPVNPVGSGRGGTNFDNFGDEYSLLVEAKVPNASAHISYSWGRTFNMRTVLIRAPSATNSNWYVFSVNEDPRYPTGYPSVNADSDLNNLFTTTNPSPNNILYASDNPGLNLNWIDDNYSPNVNDYAYQEMSFTYYLTNTIGSAQTVAVLHVGCYTLDQLTNSITAGSNLPWTRIYSQLTTTQIPDCRQITTNQVENIVHTNAIQFDPNVNQDIPNFF